MKALLLAFIAAIILDLVAGSLLIAVFGREMEVLLDQLHALGFAP